MALGSRVKGGRLFAALLFLIGLLQVSSYYLSGALVRADGQFAIPQPDTLLYCQSAKRIVEGHPFSYSKGEKPSTGTTSHLYPFVLAVPYALGAKGDAIFRAGFFLNAGFYLIFLFAWGGIIRAKCNKESTQLLATALVALFGQSAFSAFSQTDIGFWMAASSLFALGLARNTAWLYGLMLFLAPWIRPEGMLCVLGFGMALAVKSVFGSKIAGELRRWDVLIFVLALASFCGVFAFNVWLTGSPTFSSLAHKGHFWDASLSHAVHATATDFMILAKAIFLGIPRSQPRDFYYIPVLGAAFLWIGVLFRSWKNQCDWRELVLWFAACGSLLSVATSGMQDMNMERYLAWIMPVISIFVAAGAMRMHGWLRRIGGFPYLPIVACVLFAMVMAVTCMCILYETSVHSDCRRDFTARCERMLSPDASVGSWGSAGGAYELGDRRFAHLAGIYSPEFMSRHIESGTFEILKHDPKSRFDYFLNWNSHVEPGFDNGEPFADSVAVFAGPGGMELRKMNWRTFDAGAMIPSCPVPGVTLQACVDVAYDVDEKSANYTTASNYNMANCDPFYRTAKNDGVLMTDCGRVILGYDEMSVPLIEEKDVYVVMRVLPSVKVVQNGAFNSSFCDCVISNPATINILIDGLFACTCNYHFNDDGFTDVVLTIPGDRIKGGNSRVSFCGDHITCGYWFYQ